MKPIRVCLLLWLSLGPGAGATAEAPAAQSVAVTTALPRRQAFAQTIVGYGELQADVRGQHTLSLPFAGQVLAVEIGAGETVAAGQVLLRIAPDPSARLAYAQAQQQRGLARAERAQARDLFARHLVTQVQLAAAEKALADADAAMAAQRALGAGRAQVNLTAPAAGTVAALAAAVGERFPAGAALMSLAPQTARIALIGIEPAQAHRVQPGQAVQLTPVFGGAPLSGTVVTVAAAIDGASGLIDVRVRVPAAGGLPLRAPLSARIAAGAIEAWAVPRDAVLSDANGAYLYQIAHGTAQRVNVERVQAEGDTVGVEGPLDPQRPVVVLGAYEMADGMRVQTPLP